MFVGCTTSELVVYNWFPTALKTRYIRVVPQSWNSHICLRMNIYGCPESGNIFGVLFLLLDENYKNEMGMRMNIYGCPESGNIFGVLFLLLDENCKNEMGMRMNIYMVAQNQVIYLEFCFCS